jgi:predicted dehydrogenase
MDRIRVGLIGYGVGRIYAAAFQSVNLYYQGFPPVDLVAVATATETSGRQAVEHFGFVRRTTDYREILESDDINVVVIATPNDSHHEMLVEALRTDKAIYIDKPLTTTLASAGEILDVAKETGNDAQMIFEMRFCPAIQLAHELIADGRLGGIYSFRMTYFRSSYADPSKPLRWKGKAKRYGGVLHDYASHLIDLLIWLVGVPSEVAAEMRTFVNERPMVHGSGETTPVETDDHVVLLGAYDDGPVGTIEAGRTIVGAINDLGVIVNGSKGSLKWNLMNPNYLYFTDTASPHGGWIEIPTVQNYPDAFLPGADLPVGMMRFHIASIASFLRNRLEGMPYHPGLRQGVQVQAVIEAAVEAVISKKWIKAPPVT